MRITGRGGVDLHEQWTRAQTHARRAMPEPPWLTGPRLATRNG